MSTNNLPAQVSAVFLYVEVNDFGVLVSATLTDDLHKTYLKFGQEEYGMLDAIHFQEGGLVPLTSKKKAFQKLQPRE